jgi:hypothetical protein
MSNVCVIALAAELKISEAIILARLRKMGLRIYCAQESISAERAVALREDVLANNAEIQIQEALAQRLPKHGTRHEILTQEEHDRITGDAYYDPATGWWSKP